MSKKYIFLLVIALVLVIAGSSIYYFYTASKSTNEIVTYKDPHLTEVDKKPFVDRIAENQKKLLELPKDAQPTDKFQIYMSQASDYYSLGEFGKAKELYTLAKDLFPKEASAWFSLANLEVQMNDFSGAEENFKKVLTLEPANPEYWRAYIDFGKANLGFTKERILAEMDKALTSTKDNLDIVSYKAKYLESIGDLEGAVGQWKIAIEKNPSQKELYEREIKSIQDRLK